MTTPLTAPSRRGLLKGIGALGAAAASSTVLAGCDFGGQGTSDASGDVAAAATASAAPGGDGIDLSTISTGHKVGLISLDNSAAAVAVGLQGMNAIKKEIDWEVEVVDIKGDPSAVPGAVTGLLSRKAEAILCYALPSVGLEQAVKPAGDAGVPVISLVSGRFAGADAVADFNEWISSSRTSLYTMQRMGYEGEIALLDFTGLEATAIRSIVVRDVIKRFPDVKIVEDIVVKVPGQLQDAHDRTAAFLGKHPDLKAIWCAFDDIALGANTAVKESGRDVFVTSIDGVPPALEAIRKGDPLSATCYNDQPLLMKIGVSLADRLIAGKTVPAVGYQDSPIITIDTVPKDGSLPHGFVTPFYQG
ncbi:sugar ABC transporter substrate-binding protein [Nocardioides acrostichi]|uniref:Sugar ABC transporter substrate-binding protein n=1 Tax=Nocardioides acrostichi TaxID=2784339 RepID=A0A930UW50_9ACTN|nr:sugar ABC transporter substrate-binding protein [Nocardioides acrostichi]MBF4160752.1 sugar ABC transporter substrate-binding protein [Nocardioides acrostichi]